MYSVRHQGDVRSFVTEAITASYFVAPKQPGLTYQELWDAGKVLGFEEGEITQATHGVVAPQYFGGPPYLVHQVGGTAMMMLDDFNLPLNPEPRNIEAFEFVCREMKEIARKHTVAGTQIERAVLVARALNAGLALSEHDVEVAITICVAADRFVEQQGVLRFAVMGSKATYPTPKEQRAQSGHHAHHIRENEMFRRVRPIVADIVERRMDGRPTHADPLLAFGVALESLGLKPFRLWWIQTAREMQAHEPTQSPISVTVLCAALVEGALTFVVKHARSRNMGVFASPDFEKATTKWSVDDLVASAARGGETAILDGPARARAEQLVKTRQRIHAGRMLADYPAGVPDLRPEEAIDARNTAAMVVRRVLDWLAKYPADVVPPA